MKPLTPLEKLDIVLGELAMPKLYVELKKTFPDNGKINHHALNQILEKLRNDKLREVVFDNKYETDIEIKDNRYLRRNFNGDVFVGYVKQAEINATAEKIKNNREKYLSRGTVWLAVLTGALVLTEVLIHWNELRHLFSYY
jgi:hypothetical protein